MREVEATATLEDDWQPVELCYVARGLRWTVREVLDGWTHPGWPGKTYNKPVTEKRTGCACSARCRAAGSARGVRDDRHLLRQPGPLVDQARGPRAGNSRMNCPARGS
jgi:hypothetical protein